MGWELPSSYLHSKIKNNGLQRPHHPSWSGDYAEQSSNPSDISTTTEIKLYRNKVIFLEMLRALASFPIPLRLVNHQNDFIKLYPPALQLKTIHENNYGIFDESSPIHFKKINQAKSILIQV